MSVEYCVLRVTSQIFEDLLKQPAILEDLMDEFYTSSSETNLQKEYIDAREVIRGMTITVPSTLRMLYFDEFTTSLLVDFLDESSALFSALAGWGRAHILNKVRYGYGEISYYSPQEVKVIAAELKAHSPMLLEARFWERIADYRAAAAGYFNDDQAILAHQNLFAKFLSRFYEEAAEALDSVLLMTV